MNGACDQFFASSRLPSDENGLCVTGNAVDESHELVHHRAGENELSAIDGARDYARDGRRCCGYIRIGGIAAAHWPRRDDGYNRYWCAVSVAEKRCREVHRKWAAGLGLNEQLGLIAARRGSCENFFVQIAFSTNGLFLTGKQLGELSPKEFLSCIAAERIERGVTTGQFAL